MRQCLLAIICLLVTGLLSSVVTAAPPERGILYTKPVESVMFRHDDHTQKNLRCIDCHSGLFEMEALLVQNNKDFNMESLYKGKYCGACHDGKKAFAADTQCARCHVGSNALVPKKDTPAYKMSVTMGSRDGSVVFNHEKHVKKVSCRSCHSLIFKPKEGTAKIKLADHRQKKFCFACHDERGKKAFAWNDCSRCHIKGMAAPKEAIAYGKGAKAVSFRHEKHQLKSGCKACHPQIFAYGRDARIDFNDHVDGKLCFSCHSRKKQTAFYDCQRCHKQRPAAKTKAFYPERLKYKTPMKTVHFHHASHAAFSCQECHPAPFAVKKGETKMIMAEMFQGKTCGMCHDGKKEFSVRECARCHKN